MGMPIARNLAERGFEVIGYRRSGSPELIASGGIAAGSPAEVAERSMSCCRSCLTLPRRGGRLRRRGHADETEGGAPSTSR